MVRRLLFVVAALVAAACTTDRITSSGRIPARGRAGLHADATSEQALGRLIFFDQRLSANQNQSCSYCHDPGTGWTGSESDLNATGGVHDGSIEGRFGNRKPPSSAYATFSPTLHLEFDKKASRFVGGNFWDGRATGERLGTPATDQSLGPFLNPVEMALTEQTDLVVRICAGPYADLFVQVWGAQACDPSHVVDAFDAVGFSIAAFEASAESNAFSSRYDDYLAKAVNLNAEEHLGVALFRGKAKCAACHVIDGGPKGRPLFTDFSYDNIGVPKNPENPWYTMPTEFNPAGAAWIDQGLGGFLATRTDYQAYASANVGKQKVPTLRNVDLRPSPDFVKAYAHNGYFKSLEGVVHFHNTRDVKPVCAGPYTEAQALAANCWPAPEVAANVNRTDVGNLHLSASEERAIVAFLKTLSDRR